MAQEIKMPSAGQTTDEATIVSIKVKVGDSVQRGDVLMEVETDKAILPVESFTTGQVLKIFVSEGDQVEAGTVLLSVGQAGETAPEIPASVQTAPPPAASSGSAGAACVGQQIKMPAAGQTTDEATIVSIKVKPGDSVQRGDVLMEVETDKAILPVESYIAGQVFDVLVQECDRVSAGDVLAVIGNAADAASYQRNSGAAAPVAAPAVVSAPSSAAQDEYLPIIKGQTTSARVSAPVSQAAMPAMPGAKALARELGISLSQITASNGQFIKKSDVRSYRPAAPIAACNVADYAVLPQTRMRAIIGKRMQESLQNIPAWQCTVKIDMTACMALRNSYLEKRNCKLSYNDLMAKAIAVASRKFSLVRARWEEGEVHVYQHANIGLAVALDGALVVPVVREVDAKGLEELSGLYRELIEKARSGKLSPSDMGCGSITVSNLGMYDVAQFTAIVNPPESCILAVSSIVTEPVWDGKAFQPVPRMTVTGSFDHRMIDGAYGAQFLQELKLLMENPALML